MCVTWHGPNMCEEILYLIYTVSTAMVSTARLYICTMVENEQNR